jgi:hypothetical protein
MHVFMDDCTDPYRAGFNRFDADREFFPDGSHTNFLIQPDVRRCVTGNRPVFTITFQDRSPVEEAGTRSRLVTHVCSG